MTRLIEITRLTHVRLMGGSLLAFAVIFAGVLWKLQVGWAAVLICSLILIPLGAVGLTMLVRRPQAVLWFEDGLLHWHEDSCLPFQRSSKGSLPVSDIAHIRSICTPLTESFLFALVITTADGQEHRMPPNLSEQTRERRLNHLLATLRAHRPAITFDEVQAP